MLAGLDLFFPPDVLQLAYFFASAGVGLLGTVIFAMMGSELLWLLGVLEDGI